MSREMTVTSNDRSSEGGASGDADQQRPSQDTGGPTAFVFPWKRVGIDAKATDFDTEAFLDELGADMRRLQHAKLREILELQAGVEYLQRHGLNGRTDVESFRKCVPLVSYGDLEADILRLVNGETTAPIFTVDPITEFHMTSGTIGGRPKYVPGTARYFGEELQFFFDFWDASHRRAFPGFKGGKSLNILFAGKQIVTPSGLKAGGLTTNYYRSARFLNRERHPDDEICVPDEVILCDDMDQGMYCHLLCALARAPEIVNIKSAFAVSVVAAATALQHRWRSLAEDIRAGTLNPDIITSPALREAVAPMLRPNPELGSRIQSECSQENWEGIFPRLFPNAYFLQCVLSGNMLQYAPAVKHFAGRLPLVSPVYAGTECGHLGINPRMNCSPEDITYVLWPGRTYCEFIPVDGDHGGSLGEEARVLEAWELEVGQKYELVVTNNTGLYRYRVGDVLRVTSFRKTLLVFAFVCRLNVVLSASGDEKTDEVGLQAAVSLAAGLLREAQPAMQLADYTATVDVTSSPGRYVIFWELVDSRDSNLDPIVLQKCANTLDGSFYYDYRGARRNGEIGPLKLCIVRKGTFSRIFSEAMARGASPLQYKMPRSVSNHPQALEILRTQTLRVFHSTITPNDCA